jgi:predicted TIM-barrel enzyme
VAVESGVDLFLAEGKVTVSGTVGTEFAKSMSREVTTTTETKTGMKCDNKG